MDAYFVTQDFRETAQLCFRKNEQRVVEAHVETLTAIAKTNVAVGAFGECLCLMIHGCHIRSDVSETVLN